VRPKNGNLIPEYLANLTSSEYGRRYFLSCSKQSTNLASINSSQLKAFPIPLPPLPEQRAIAAVLSAWDRAIRQTTDLLDAKRRLKLSLMQQLLTGKRRFPGFTQPLRNLRLRDVTEECSERNRNGLGTGVVMAVTKAEGIVPMRERLIGADLERYKQVRKDWFAYNPMRINIGSIARSHSDKTVLVSPDYVVFRCREESADQPGIDPDYLDHVRKSDRWASFVTSSGNGSVRVRIYYDDLGVMPLQLPCMAEQRKIASLLNALDCEITLLTQQLAALKTQKRGLMRKLLTGEVRVKVPS
jgi:type I restriction enzyme S subunit